MTCLLGNEVNELRNNLVMKLFGDWLLSQIETRYSQVCCERDGHGEVYIVDPGNPTEIKQTFVATKSSIICICYVPAAEPLLELGIFIVYI